MSKGSSFEREICKKLSLWWTNGERDDVFWRTSNSGGRATVRGRKGKGTANQHGDICATDPVGIPFLEVVTLEIKRGYSSHTPFDLVDKSEKAGAQQWEKWFDQAERSREQSGALYWAVLSRRDKRQAVIAYPRDLNTKLLLNRRAMTISCNTILVREWVVIDRLDTFLSDVSAVYFRKTFGIKEGKNARAK